jgi:tetratricopeptide (TPR) repeat protein
LLAPAFLAALLFLLEPGALLSGDREADLAKLSSLNAKVVELYQAGKFSEAIPIAKKALELSTTALGPDNPDTATALTRLALLYKSKSEYAKAERLYQRALKIYETALGPDNSVTATALNNLAELYKATGDYAKAEPLYQRALKITEKALGSPSPEEGEERGVEERQAVPRFPWPPPKASAEDTISRELLVGNVEHPRLATVAQAIETAFRQAGYGKKSYYSVPSGFAMASQIEQINEDGSPKESVDRWSLEVLPIRHFSLGLYLNALFRARPGYYRVIVFIVTSKAFSQSNTKVSEADARLWISSGLNKLPEEIGNQEYSPAYSCTALIYEFKKTGKHADLIEQRISGETHLQKSGLLAALAKPR